MNHNHTVVNVGGTATVGVASLVAKRITERIINPSILIDPCPDPIASCAIWGLMLGSEAHILGKKFILATRIY